MEVLATLENSPVVGHESLGLVPFSASIEPEKGGTSTLIDKKEKLQLSNAIIKRDPLLDVLIILVI